MASISRVTSRRRQAPLTRRLLLTLAALTVLPRPVAATTPATEGGPAAPIATLYAALERMMRTGATWPFVARFQEIAPVIDRVFDLADILTLSVGARWSSLEASVQAQLFKAFRDFTIATYVANFDSYDGERFDVLAGQRAVGADRVVATRIIQANGNPVRLDYLMRPNEQSWRVVDVLLDGTISRVAVQRSDFRALLTNGGAAALMDSLRHKTADLSGGVPLDR